MRLYSSTALQLYSALQYTSSTMVSLCVPKDPHLISDFRVFIVPRARATRCPDVLS